MERSSHSGVASKPSRDFGAVGERRGPPKSRPAPAESAATAATEVIMAGFFDQALFVYFGVFCNLLAS